MAKAKRVHKKRVRYNLLVTCAAFSRADECRWRVCREANSDSTTIMAAGESRQLQLRERWPTTSDERLLASARCGARRRCRYYDDDYGDGQWRPKRTVWTNKIINMMLWNRRRPGAWFGRRNRRGTKKSRYSPRMHEPQSSSDSFPRHRKSSTARSDELRHVSDFLFSDRHRVHILHLPVITSQLVVGQRIFSFHQFQRHNFHIHQACDHQPACLARRRKWRQSFLDRVSTRPTALSFSTTVVSAGQRITHYLQKIIQQALYKCITSSTKALSSFIHSSKNLSMSMFCDAILSLCTVARTQNHK